jgi:hypothetical protein
MGFLGQLKFKKKTNAPFEDEALVVRLSLYYILDLWLGFNCIIYLTYLQRLQLGFYQAQVHGGFDYLRVIGKSPIFPVHGL